MSSNYVFCGYDMQDANSKAGRSVDGGINLNSVTVRYNLQNNPDLCRMIYEGLIPSTYGNTPTVSDGGSCNIDDLPTVCDLDEKGEIEKVNPIELAMMSGQMPTAQFTGALNPIYHDNAQPIPGGYNMPFSNTTGMNPFGMMQQQQSGFAPINYMMPGTIPYNYNPVNPSIPYSDQQLGPAMKEWNDYQRTKGFRAPIPYDTDFPEFGLLSGFHQGFNPDEATAPGQDEFFDVTFGGRFGISQIIHQQGLVNASSVWGWNIGDVIDRREQMMFPGINADHNNPTPSNNPVICNNGTVQRRITGNTGMPRMFANQLPIPNMVSTNPYMAGTNMVGGFMMGQPTRVPTPYMQARYNYAIHNGFQSIQEMDINDFRILKRISKIAHPEMSKEEFDDHFYKNWSKQFIDANNFRKKCEEESQRSKFQSNTQIDKVVCKLVKGDKVLSGVDCNDPVQYRELTLNVKRCNASYRTPEQERAMQMAIENERALKDMRINQLYQQAPERKYDDKSFLDFMEHGFVESFFYHLAQKEILDRADPKKRLAAAHIDQSAFIKNCIENGMTMPAARARLLKEDEMFYVNRSTGDPEVDGKQRGSWGMKANGQPLDPQFYPMYGYVTYIRDPENPEKSIPFPRQYIEDLWYGYNDFCAAINAKSKKKIQPMTFDEFQKVSSVRVCDNDEFMEKYSGIPGTEKYIEAAKRGIDMNRPFWANLPSAEEQDKAEREDPNGDVPLEVLLEDLQLDQTDQP